MFDQLWWYTGNEDSENWMTTEVRIDRKIKSEYIDRHRQLDFNETDDLFELLSLKAEKTYLKKDSSD